MREICLALIHVILFLFTKVRKRVCEIHGPPHHKAVNILPIQNQIFLAFTPKIPFFSNSRIQAVAHEFRKPPFVPKLLVALTNCR